MINYSKQQGFNILVASIALGALMFVAMIGIKTIPPYLDFYSLTSIVDKVLDESGMDLGSPSDIESSIRQRLLINNIDAVDQPGTMVIKKAGGFLRVTIDYTIVSPLPTPVMQNTSEISLHMHFHKESERDLDL